MNRHILASIPLFANLSADQQDELAQAFKQQQVSAGQPIFWVGDDGTTFCIITHGHVRLTCPDEQGQEVVLAEQGPGQFFGELSLLDGGRRTATARAISDTTLLTLDRESFLKFLLKHPTVTVQMISELGRRQREMVDKVRGIANANDLYKETTTAWNRIADIIATVSASKGFVLLHFTAVILWVALNLILGEKGWDPYPFLFLTMWASLEAIFLSMFVLISQNRQGEKDRIRADLDYQVNRKAHMEVMQLHEKMDRIESAIDKLKEPAEV